MQISIGVAISIIALMCTIIGAIIGFLTFNRNRDKDVKTDASQTAIISTKLDAIGSDVKSLMLDIKTEQLERIELTERVTRTEESVKQAHKRIDKLEEDNCR